MRAYFGIAWRKRFGGDVRHRVSWMVQEHQDFGVRQISDLDESLSVRPLYWQCRAHAIAGIGTQFRRFDVHGGRGEGFVARSDTGAGVSGPVLISIAPVKPDERGTEVLHEVIAQGGRFVVEIGEKKDSHGQAHYLGTYPCGPCDSKVVKV